MVNFMCPHDWVLGWPDSRQNIVFGLVCKRGRGWDNLGEWHWNMYNIVCEISRQFRFDARYWILGAGALGQPRGMVRGERREEGSGWGTRVYLWQIHVDTWQNQYNIVKLKNKNKKVFLEEISLWISRLSEEDLFNTTPMQEKIKKNSAWLLLID